MLRDLKAAQERWAFERREAKKLPEAFGEFIAGLAPWSWFVNPLTLRNENADSQRSHPGILMQNGKYAFYEPDPRIESWRPTSRHSSTSGIPNPYLAVARINSWLADMGVMARRPIGWVLAEEFGRIGGRWHCHILISEVSHLSRRYWWTEAFRRFGYTRIDVFDPARGAAFYAAKYASNAVGNIHFGGTLAGRNLSVMEQPTLPGSYNNGGREIVRSPDMAQEFFKRALRRWHR